MIDLIFDEKGDRVTTMLVNIFHNIIPHVKDKSTGNFPQAYFAVSLIAALCEYPYTLRAWRKDILDLFYENDFFLMNFDALSKWTIIMDFLMKPSDPKIATFLELLRRGLTSYQSPLFISREQDLANKARQVKRISFVIYAGQIDQYISFLPALQEKVVEALKIPNASPIHIQVFLLIRVLLLRFSASHLRLFWPTVVTELMRIFAEPTIDPPLILAACKFLDLVLLLRTEEFLLYEWIFISDIIGDKIEQTSFLPVMDNILHQYQSQQISSDADMIQAITTSTSTSATHRKLLITMNHVGIDAKGEEFTTFVEHFLKKWRFHAYNNVVSSLLVDYESINHSLESDFIEYNSIVP